MLTHDKGSNEQIYISPIGKQVISVFFVDKNLVPD